MASQNPKLAAFVDAFRQRLFRHMWLEGLAKFGTAAFGVFVLSVAVFYLGGPGTAIRWIFWPATAIAAAYAIQKYWRRPRQLYKQPNQVARLIESLKPDYNDRLVSAVELDLHNGDAGYYSHTLAEAAVADTATGLPNASAIAMPHRSLRLPLSAFLLGLAALVSLLAISPGHVKGTWSALWGNHVAQAYQVGDVAFLAGDIDITYHYPAYTGLPPNIVKNASGELEGYPGTRVNLSVTSSSDAESASIEFDKGDAISLSPEKGRRFSGEFVITEDDAYHFEFDGTSEAISRPVRILADRSPSVFLDFPAEDLDVRETDMIELAYRLEDDFGLGQLALVFNMSVGFEREDRRVDLVRFESETKSEIGTYEWELSKAQFKPGDTVTYWLEATDNDTVNGPKTGKSAIRTLKIFSIHEHHEKLLAQQEKIWESMIELLAKYLVQRIDPTVTPDVTAFMKVIDDTRLELTQLLIDPLASLISALKDDPLATDAVESVLSSIHADLSTDRAAYEDTARNVDQSIARHAVRAMPYYLLDSLRKGTVARLEKHIITLYEMLQKQKYDAMVSESEKLSDIRDQLRQLMEEYKKTGDEAVKRRIEELLKQFRDKLAELQAKMAKVSKEIPEEFVNMEALNSQAMNKDLKSLEDLLKSGDLDEALKQLENLSQMLNDTLDKLREGSEDLGESLYSESMKELLNFKQDLDQLSDQEKDLHKETQAELDAYREQMKKEMEKNLDKLMKELSDKVKDAQDETEKVDARFDEWATQYQQSAKGNMDTLLKSLDAKDVVGSLEIAKQSVNKLRSLMLHLEGPQAFFDRHPAKKEPDANLKHAGKAKKNIDEVIEELEDIMPDPEKFLSPEQMMKLQQMAQKQKNLSKEGRRLQQSAQKLKQDMPFMPQSCDKNMQQAVQGMDGASGKLGQLQPNKAEGHQQQAIHNLDQLQQGLEEAMQQMQNQMKFGGSRPTMRGGKGGRGLKQEKVAIPKAGEYKTPKELREDLLEAMKRKGPEEYESQNRQYYKELVK